MSLGFLLEISEASTSSSFSVFSSDAGDRTQGLVRAEKAFYPCILGYGYGASTIFKNIFTGLGDGSMCTVAYGANLRARVQILSTHAKARLSCMCL